jgi:hypothetical protein
MYKGYRIVKNDFGYYEAYDVDNNNEYYLYAKTIEQLKIEIDEQEDICTDKQ